MTVFLAIRRRLRARRGRTVAAVASAVAIVTTTAVAEAVVRDRVGDQIATGAERKLHLRPDVSLGATPVLMQLAGGSLRQVELSAEDATLGKREGIDVDAQLTDVVRGQDSVSVHSSSVTAGIDAAALSPAEGARVEADPQADRLVVRAGPGGLVELPLTPQLQGSAITLKPGEPSVGGRPLPTDAADGITERAQRSIQLPDLPLDLQPRSLTVTADGLELGLSGGAAALTS